MNMEINNGWQAILEDELQKDYFTSLKRFVGEEYSKNPCYPPEEQIFRAFDLCDLQELKVVILGQDPYHGAGQANGLSFSVSPEIPHPPSLRNIFRELEEDLEKPYPDSGDLGDWARQGVLLLNATLTVRASEAGSHQGRGWEKFTDQVIKRISDACEGVVFMLWGGFAGKKHRLIDKEKHLILQSGHPSPLSANRGYWFGNRHFSKCNRYLEEKGKAPIKW
ncbi:uracil-DNA glycosylase [Robertkochia flava]|uniref:uracil-DNA glycosylase n=1 Tax=Robertkochia flava TaxID=3447986 RepID=UPI001CC92622|nr:uracil-DNA glycosylase [Robertkochia marina]